MLLINHIKKDLLKNVNFGETLVYDSFFEFDDQTIEMIRLKMEQQFQDSML